MTASLRLGKPGRPIDSVYGMDCVLVNVAGPGLKPTISFEQLKQRDPVCMGLGTLFPAVPLYELLSDGATLKLPAGPDRNVQVLGIHSSTLGSSCAGKTLAELFAESVRPQVFVLGETRTDIFRDTAVRVVSTYSSSTKDLGEVCPTQSTGGETGNPGATGTVKGYTILTGTNNAPSRISSYRITESHTFAELDTVLMDGQLRSMVLSPDRSRLMGEFHANLTTSDTFQLGLTLNGSNAGKFSSTPGAYLTGLGYPLRSGGAFAPLAIGEFFYYINGSSIFQVSYTNSAASALSPPSIVSPVPFYLTPTDSHLWSIGHNDLATPSYVWVNRHGYNANGQLTAEAQGHLSFSLNAFTKLIYEPALKRFFFSIGNKIHYWELHGNVLNQLSELTIPSTGPIRSMAFDSASRTLVVISENVAATGTNVTFHGVPEAGIILGSTSVIPIPLLFDDMKMTPDAKYILLTKPTGTDIYLYSLEGFTGAEYRTTLSLTSPVLSPEILPLY